jgi:ribonuclease J
MNQSAQDELIFLPLGGAGEIGMNLNLYGLGPGGDEKWIMLDLGVTFNDGTMPGVDLITPDPAFIEERRENLLGLILTHAHEDHLGAVPYLWPRLRCPVYATPFTASILKAKLIEANLEGQVEINIIPLSGTFSIGPFDMELITLTHSIPEPNAVVIRTKLGTILHTGDWKFDPNPVTGPSSDIDALRKLGDEGVLAIVCDSTNVFNPGQSGSEADLLPNLTEAIAECTGKVAVACFASNVARLETVSAAARANGRDVVSAGRSLKRIERASRENGYLAETPAFIDQEDAGYLPDDRTLIICTGSQGEPRAALSRIAAGDHPSISMGEGDTVIFSSRMIPGNEVSIGRLHNQLIRKGVKIVTPKDRFIHVSGHPARDELIEMYQLVRPEISVPVHGEIRHLREHARLARECQVDTSIVVENGGVVRLAPNSPGVIDHVPSGRLSQEGNRMVPLGSEIQKSRVRAMWHGTVTMTIVVDTNGHIIDPPLVATTGLFETDSDPVLLEASEVAERAAKMAAPVDRRDDKKIGEVVRIAVRRHFRNSLDKKPVTTIHVVRVD